MPSIDICPFHSTTKWEKTFEIPKTACRNRKFWSTYSYLYQQIRQTYKSSLQLEFCKPLMMFLFFRLYLVTKYSTRTAFLISSLLLKCAPVKRWIASAKTSYSSFVDLTIRTWTWFVCIEISFLNILSKIFDYLSHHNLDMVLLGHAT